MLLCGDAKDRSAAEQLMGGLQADMIFTDPPYNVRINGHVSGLGRTHHREFVEASGEMSLGEFTDFLRQSLAVAASVCRDGAIADVCMYSQAIDEHYETHRERFSYLENAEKIVTLKPEEGNSEWVRNYLNDMRKLTRRT